MAARTPQGQGNTLGQVMHRPQRPGQQDRGQRTTYGQSHAGQDIMEMDVEIPVRKGDLVALEQAAHLGSRHCGNGDGDDVHGAPLAENDLDSEHHAGDGGVEYGGDGACRTASHQCHPLAVIERKGLGDVRTDGRAAHHHRGFRSGGPAAADGQATGDQPGKTGPQAQQPTVSRDGVDDFGNAVAGAFVDDFFQEERGEGRPGCRQKNGPPVNPIVMKPRQHDFQAAV